MTNEKFIIHKQDGFIYKINENTAIGEIEGIQFHLLEQELIEYKEITKEQYYDIYYATKNNSYSYEDETYLWKLIDNILSTKESE